MNMKILPAPIHAARYSQIRPGRSETSNQSPTGHDMWRRGEASASRGGNPDPASVSIHRKSIVPDQRLCAKAQIPLCKSIGPSPAPASPVRARREPRTFAWAPCVSGELGLRRRAAAPRALLPRTSGSELWRARGSWKRIRCVQPHQDLLGERRLTVWRCGRASCARHPTVYEMILNRRLRSVRGEREKLGRPFSLHASQQTSEPPAERKSFTIKTFKRATIRNPAVGDDLGSSIRVLRVLQSCEAGRG